MTDIIGHLAEKFVENAFLLYHIGEQVHLRKTAPLLLPPLLHLSSPQSVLD